MNILIKGKRMPERCSDDCPCAYCEDFNDDEAWCEATIDMKAISFLDVHRPDWCPLVEVEDEVLEWLQHHAEGWE